MASSSSYFDDLTCSICLTIFTDPVILLCGHSFCRDCITLSLSSQQQCPQCRAAVSTEKTFLPTNHILKSLAEKAKQGQRPEKECGNDKVVAEGLCPEHEEKLKLFCVTDQQLACIICRDGERHEGHKFKPIREAAVSLRKDLETFVQHVSDDIQAVESLANTQRAEITKTKVKSEQLATQIRRQFEEMHQFLRKREDEIKNELKYKEGDAVEKMSASLKAIETALSESRELEGKVTSVLKITDSERFLKSWTEDNSTITARQAFRPRKSALQVVNTSLSLGPYESHLQFFMWKEMLQVVQPRAELLSLTSSSPAVTVSDDGRSLFSQQNPSSTHYDRWNDPYNSPRSHSNQRNYFQRRAASQSVRMNPAFSTDQFSKGQHYWEIDVGQRGYWELGVQNHFLKYDGVSYVACRQNTSTVLAFEDRPRKIGIHLNCTSNKVSFFDADNMKQIHTMSSCVLPTPVSAYFSVDYNKADHSPLTVCWY